MKTIEEIEIFVKKAEKEIKAGKDISKTETSVIYKHETSDLFFTDFAEAFKNGYNLAEFKKTETKTGYSIELAEVVTKAELAILNRLIEVSKAINTKSTTEANTANTEEKEPDQKGTLRNSKAKNKKLFNDGTPETKLDAAVKYNNAFHQLDKLTDKNKGKAAVYDPEIKAYLEKFKLDSTTIITLPETQPEPEAEATK